MKSIAIIGYFGYVTNQIDGQTIKTREIYQLIKDKLPNTNLKYVDTQNLQKNKITTYFRLLCCVLSCSVIIYLPGQNNLKRFFPILFNLSKLLGHKIIYPVVGGWLAEYISDKPDLQNKLREINAILVETNNLKNKLEKQYGFSNVDILTNFRSSNYAPYKNNIPSQLRVVFMARITEAKGCNIIFNVARLLKENGIDYIIFTFYGKIDPSYESEFLQKLDNNPNCNYGGIIEPDDVYSILNKHDLLILPTHYEGEGFPGSIVDAYKAGIPVMVSNWKDIPEFVLEGETGFVLDPFDEHGYYNKLKDVYLNHKLLLDLKNQAFKESQKYSAESGWKVLSRYL